MWGEHAAHKQLFMQLISVNYYLMIKNGHDKIFGHIARLSNQKDLCTESLKIN